MNFLNLAISAAALVIYLPGLCTHTDTEGKQRKITVRNILIFLEKTIFDEQPVWKGVQYIIKRKTELRKARQKQSHGNMYRVFIKYCVFFEDFKIYSGLWPLSVSHRCQCVYTMVGKTTALQQQNLKSSEIKSQHFKEKHNI